MNNLTPDQALQILSDALQPQMLGTNPRLTRQGFVALEQALQTLAEALKPSTQASDATHD